MNDNESKTYETDDIVLPMVLKDQKTINIKVRITGDRVALFVGPRDWSWDKETGKFIGAGTCLGG